MALPILSALLQFLSFPPLSFSYLSFFFLVPLFLFIARNTEWRKLVIGIVLFRALSLVLIVSYTPEPLLILSEIVVFSPFIFLVLIGKRLRLAPLPFLLLAGVSFFVSEYFSAWYAPLPTFVALSGLPLAGTFFLPLSKFGGFIGLSLLVIAVNVGITHAIRLFLEHRKNVNEESAKLAKREIFYTALFIVLIIGCAVYASYRIEKARELFARDNPQKESLSVMLVSTGEKFEDGTNLFDETRASFSAPKLGAYISTTLEQIGRNFGTTTPDIVILPENMFDFFLFNESNSEMKEKFNIVTGGTIFNQFQQFAKEHHVAVLSSLHTIDAEGNKRQTAFLIDADGHFIGISQKYHLTIATERWPFGNHIPFYWRMAVPFLPATLRREEFIALSPTGQYSPAPVPFTTIAFKGVSFGPLICSDEHYPDGYRTLALRGADVFLGLSNNSWIAFAGSQYRAEVDLVRRVYASEYGKPVLISGKNESAGIIYPDGRFEGAHPKKTDTIITAALNIRF
ncbi:MAG: nitrilase-related carbon-nitrogen hydrolase [bacterium]|nr:nitrilase-related carbon-nitrogen hydrolase [bacterium]